MRRRFAFLYKTCVRFVASPFSPKAFLGLLGMCQAAEGRKEMRFNKDRGFLSE